MFTDMKLWNDVRHAVLVDNMSKRQAAKTFQINYRSVCKIVAQAEPPEGMKLKKARSKTKMEPFIPLIHAILDADRDAPKKQKHTGKRIYDRLKNEHDFTGSLSSVYGVINAYKRKHAEVFLPLKRTPGDAQFDFGHAKAIIGGVLTKVAFGVMTLAHSNARFVQAFPRETTETFQETLKRAFLFFGGVPKMISFDNSRIAVKKILHGRGCDPTDGFLRIQSHFLFKHHFCQVRKGNQKGRVENAVGYVRRNFMVPLPEFPDFESFNEYLSSKCLADRANICTREKKPICELLEEETKCLTPLPEEDFEARRIEFRRSNSLSLVRFDTNDYSVPTEHAHKLLTLVGGVDTVKILCDAKTIATHTRDWGRKNIHFDPIHYLRILERKPNALDFGRPFQSWVLPKDFDVLRRRLEDAAGPLGTKEFIRVLRLLEKYTTEQLTKAVSRALELGASTYEAVFTILIHHNEVKTELFVLDGRPHLQQVRIGEPLINQYTLLAREKTNHEKIGNEINGLIETSFETIETPDDGKRMRIDGGVMCQRERRSSRISSSIIGTGIAGSGSESGATTIEVGEVSELKNARELRFQGSTVDQQDVGQRVDAGGVHSQSRIHHSHRASGNGQDTPGDGVGCQGLPDGKESAFLSRDGLGDIIDRSERGTSIDANEKEYGVT